MEDQDLNREQPDILLLEGIVEPDHQRMDDDGCPNPPPQDALELI